MRYADWLYLRTAHDAYHLWPDEMLFDLSNDPHQQVNLVRERPEALQYGRDKLDTWHAEMLVNAARGRDPHENVMAEGGPYHVRGKLPTYLERLRASDRSHLADQLAEKYGL